MFERDPSSAQVGLEILPFEMGDLPEFFQRKAEVELHDTPGGRVLGLQQIRDLIKADKHMCNLELNEDFILQYLRVRKFNVSRAFHNLRAYTTLRRKAPNMFTGLTFQCTSFSMENQIVSLLPFRCHDGCIILLVELDNWNPETFTIEEVKKMVVVYILGSLQEPMTQVNGIKVIFDVKSNPLRHLRYCTPQNLYLLYHGTQECCPARYKEIHVVNNSLTFRAAWLAVKPFLSDKIRKRFHFHDDSKSLLEFFNPAVLPAQYGGELKDYSMLDWLKKTMEPSNRAKMLGGVSGL